MNSRRDAFGHIARLGEGGVSDRCVTSTRLLSKAVPRPPAGISSPVGCGWNTWGWAQTRVLQLFQEPNARIQRVISTSARSQSSTAEPSPTLRLRYR